MAVAYESKWDRYRNEEQRIETDLNYLLAEYEKCRLEVSHVVTQGTSATDSRVPSLIAKHQSDLDRLMSEGEKVYKEIVTLLDELKSLSDNLQRDIDDPGSSSNKNNKDSTNRSTMIYLRSKCGTIARDFSQALRRTRKQIGDDLNRFRLYTNTHRNGRSSANERENTTVHDSLIEEHSSLSHSMAIVDMGLEQMEATKKELENQSGGLSDLSRTLTKYTSLFPGAQTLMNQIGRYRNRDSIVLAITIALCLTFMFIYWMNK